MANLTTRITAPLALAAALSLHAGAVFAQKKPPIKIGMPVALSGPYGVPGEEEKRGVEYAVKEINANGGIDGRLTEVDYVDAQDTPEVALRVAEQLVGDGYKLLVGTTASSQALALANQLEKWDALFIGFVNKSDRITGDSCNPRSFRVDQSDSMDTFVIGPWLKTRTEQDWAILGVDYTWGHDSAAAFTKAASAAGKNVKGAFFAPVGTKDYAPYIQQIMAQKVQGVWLAIGGGDVINFSKQANQFGLSKSVLLVGQSNAVPLVIKALGEAADGQWGIINYTASIDTPANRAFVADWTKEYGKVPSNYEGISYVGMKLLFSAIAKAGTDDPSKVAKALEGLSIETPLFGTVTMRAEDHQLMMPNYIGKITKVGDHFEGVVDMSFDSSHATPGPSSECKMN